MNYKSVYLKWLSDQLTERQINATTWEITTPFLDRHNDYTQVYIQELEQNFYRLSDDAYTLSDLRMSGLEIGTPKRKNLLGDILRRRGVHWDASTDELWLTSTKDNLGEAQHNLLQSMLDVNDLFYTHSRHIKNLFLEDVQSFFDFHEIYYSKDISIKGVSGYTQTFEFIMQRNRSQPERFIKVMNKPDRANAERSIFSWEDIRSNRNTDSQLIILMNDENTPCPTNIITMLEAYHIKTVLWSTKVDSIELFN